MQAGRAPCSRRTPRRTRARAAVRWRPHGRDPHRTRRARASVPRAREARGQRRAVDGERARRIGDVDRGAEWHGTSAIAGERVGVEVRAHELEPAQPREVRRCENVASVVANAVVRAELVQRERVDARRCRCACAERSRRARRSIARSGARTNSLLGLSARGSLACSMKPRRIANPPGDRRQRARASAARARRAARARAGRSRVASPAASLALQYDELADRIALLREPVGVDQRRAVVGGGGDRGEQAGLSTARTIYPAPPCPAPAPCRRPTRRA